MKTRKGIKKMNPYEVLGIKQNATPEEIKTAYRTLVKKYHPDKHQDNPLSDLASEKLMEINQAYEMLTNGAPPNGAYANKSGFGQGGPGYSDGYATNPKPGTAEWFYQAGVASINKGWYDDGLGKLQTAVSMEPNNPRYREAFNQVSNTGGGYRQAAYGRGYGNQNDDLCRMMQCLVCTDCLCDCI
jgi:molecular chaperone DnaJ